MLLLLLGLIAYAEEPALSIVVSDTRYEEIYMEEPRVICEMPCAFDQDTSLIFVEANRKHRTWLKAGKVSTVYNDETINYAYEDCNFKKEPHKCASENGIWVLQTTITQDSERASINFILFDDSAAVIGQSTFTRFKKQNVIKRQRVTQHQTQGSGGVATKCDEQSGACATIPIQGQGNRVSQTEDLEPTIIDIPPTISARDVGQAMIMLYDSVR